MGLFNFFKKPDVGKIAQKYFDIAREYSREGNVTAAIDHYTKSIQASPTSAAFFNRGNSYNSKGDQTKAISDYTKAIEMNPKDFSAYNNRGMIYVQRQDTLNALHDFEKVFELTPDSQEGKRAKENISKLHSFLDDIKKEEDLRGEVLNRVKVDKHGTSSLSLSIDEYNKLKGR